MVQKSSFLHYNGYCNSPDTVSVLQYGDKELSMSHFYDYEAYEMTLKSSCFERYHRRVLQHLYYNLFLILLDVEHVLKHHNTTYQCDEKPIFLKLHN